jgi:TatD DNase family protein
MYVDSHCHLIHSRFHKIGGAEQVILNAHEAGIDAMLTVCCDIHDEFPRVLELARSYDNLWCTIGTHPHDASLPEEKAYDLDQLCELATSDHNIIGIGESGLDYFYKNSEPDDQIESFRKHIRACIETGLPLIVHARDADDDIISILTEESRGKTLTGVMHCFSSGADMGHKAIDLGFYISFSGIVTFKNADDLRDFASAVPIERLLIETDAPFLAPEPYRGKINEPAYIIETSKCLAQLHDKDEEEMASITKQNFFNLFTKARSA